MTHEDVVFQVTHATEPNESVFVLGDLPQLGAGELPRAIELHDFGDSTWRIVVRLPVNHTYTYQYFTRRNPAVPGSLCSSSNALPIDAPTTARTATVILDQPHKLVIYRSDMESPVVHWRQRSWTFQTERMRQVGLGRSPGESTWLVTGFGLPGSSMDFFITDDRSDRRDPASGTYTTRLDTSLLQDGNLFTYVPAANVSSPRQDYDPESPPTLRSLILEEDRAYRVLLPRGYDTHTTRRYPVIYENDSNPCLEGGRILDLLGAEHGDHTGEETRMGRMQEAIVVGVDTLYVGVGICDLTHFTRDLLPPGDTWNGTDGHADRYAEFIITELKPLIDSNYRTLPDRDDTATIGISLAGTAALYLGWDFADVFGRVGSQSGAFHEFWDLNFRNRLLSEPGRDIRIYIDSGDTGRVEERIYEGTHAVRDAFLGKTSESYVIDGNLRYVYGCGHAHDGNGFSARWPNLLRSVFPGAEEPSELLTDCDGNGNPDDAQITNDPTLDLDVDGVLDVCEPDCNSNGLPDDHDIATGTSSDCDANGRPDTCDPDCNQNGVPDRCDLAATTSPDCNTNGTPDECEVGIEAGGDCAVFHTHRVGVVAFGPLAGATRSSESCLELVGAAGNLSGTRDTFHLAHKSIAGDFHLTARVDEWTAESTSSKLGLMVRESLERDARHGTVAIERSSTGFRHRFLQRETAGGRTTSSRHDTYEQPAVWLCIERRGTSISGQLSLDGTTWTEPDTVELPGLGNDVYVGVASSYLGDEPSFARVCNIALEPIVVGPAPSFLRGDCDGDGDACSGVNDALTLLGWLFRGDTRPECVAACDSNGDGEAELTDAVFGLDFCFKGTAPPPAPYPACGPGRSADAALGCRVSGCK